MSSDTIATLGSAAIIVAFLWNLHRDVAGLRQRMARLECNMEVLIGCSIDRETSRKRPTHDARRRPGRPHIASASHR